MNNFVRKQLKSRDEKLKYDFLPPMLEIIETPTNRGEVILLYVIIALLLSTVLWAGLTKLDIAVTATGSVQAEPAVVTLNSISEGIIRDVVVTDGAYVREGDIICTLVSEVSEAVLKEYEYNLEVLKIQKTLYEELYRKYKENDYTELDIEPETYKENTKIAEEIILQNKAFLRNIQLLTEDRLQSVKEAQLLSVVQKLNEIDAKMETISSSLVTGKRNLEDHYIKAIVDGVYSVHDRLYCGKKISPGEIVGYITPKETSYGFTAYVSDADIAQINVGDNVRIRLTAFRNTGDETITGAITSIVDVPLTSENRTTAYVVRVQCDYAPEDMRLGMEGNFDIIVGSRTVLEYFLDPFRKGIQDSLKEK